MSRSTCTAYLSRLPPVRRRRQGRSSVSRAESWGEGEKYVTKSCESRRRLLSQTKSRSVPRTWMRSESPWLASKLPLPLADSDRQGQKIALARYQGCVIFHRGGKKGETKREREGRSTLLRSFIPRHSRKSTARFDLDIGQEQCYYKRACQDHEVMMMMMVAPVRSTGHTNHSLSLQAQSSIRRAVTAAVPEADSGI